MLKKVFCYGDSNTYGYDPITQQRHDETIRWTRLLQNKLGPAYEVVEQGCNGRTTVFPEPGSEWKSGLYGLKLCLNTYKPIELMILMLGSNDLKTMYHVTAEEIAAGAERLVVETQEFMKIKRQPIPKILLVSPIEIGSGISKTHFKDEFDETAVTRSKELPALYEAIAKRHGCYFMNAGAFAKPSAYDCLHMMPEEHKKLAEAMYDAVIAMEKG